MKLIEQDLSDESRGLNGHSEFAMQGEARQGQGETRGGEQFSL